MLPLFVDTFPMYEGKCLPCRQFVVSVGGDLGLVTVSVQDSSDELMRLVAKYSMNVSCGTGFLVFFFVKNICIIDAQCKEVEKKFSPPLN